MKLMWSALVLLAVACGDDPAAKTDANTNTKKDEGIWLPLSASAKYEGKTLEEWAVIYKQWTFAQTSCEAAAFDADGSLCDLYQDPKSPVFFMEFSAEETNRTRCRVPEGKAIFVPLANFNMDNAGVSAPLSNDDNLEIARDALATMRDLHLRADEVGVHDLDERGVGPTEFTYAIPAEPNWYSCNGVPDVADTTVNPSYLVGYFAMFPPPKPGEHQLDYGGTLTYADEEYELGGHTIFAVGESDDE